MAGKLRLKLVRSRIKANGHQRRILDGLALRKTNSESVLEDTPSIRGMINKVQHLVSVDEA